MKSSMEILKHILMSMRTGAYRRSDDEVTMQCPNCGDGGQHFSVNIIKRAYNCFKCHIGGRLEHVIRAEGSEWNSIFNLTTGSYIGKTNPIVAEQTNISNNSVIKLLQCGSSSHLCKLAKLAYEYCLKRGMTEEQIEKYQLFVRPFEPRVFFPYWNQFGNVTFWMGRALNSNIHPKTIELTGTNKPLYGRHVTCVVDEVVLVEGVFDHFATPNSYAVMGSSLTQAQVQQLVNDGVTRVFILFDVDAGSQMRLAAQKLAKARIDAYPLIIKSQQSVLLKDPADIGRCGVTKIVNAAISKSCGLRPQSIYL